VNSLGFQVFSSVVIFDRFNFTVQISDVKYLMRVVLTSIISNPLNL